MQTHVEVYCRNNQEREDDAIVAEHEAMTRYLNEMCNGRCLFLGKQREAIKEVLARCEDMILGGPRPSELGMWLAGNCRRIFG